jgi:hypothetical protein
MSADEVERIVAVLQNPRQCKIPDWMLNRQKDRGTGKSTQIFSNTLSTKLREDIEQLKKIRCVGTLSQVSGGGARDCEGWGTREGGARPASWPRPARRRSRPPVRRPRAHVLCPRLGALGTELAPWRLAAVRGDLVLTARA